jgi:hypothetical protein
MFENFYELQNRNQIFEENLSTEDRKAFEKHRAKVQAMIQYTITIKDFDDFLMNTSAERKYDHCLYKCHDAIKDSEFDAVGSETLNNCKTRCKRLLNSYKDKKLDIFYLLLMFSKRKTISCFNDYKTDPNQFYNCNWVVLNKAKRRVNTYWDEKLNKYLDAFD